MEQTDHTLKACFFSTRLVVVAATLCCLGLFAAAPASAAYEQIGCFAGSFPGPTESCKSVTEEKFSEEMQLAGVGGMAVNVNGTGGVPAGTVYAAVVRPLDPGSGVWVVMFEPNAGGLKFVEGWRVGSVEGKYERCGPPGVLPDGETLHQGCPTLTGSGPGPGRVDVDVDQTTGNIYTDRGATEPLTKDIVEYSADGGEEITRFGELAPVGQAVAESPAQIHDAQFTSSIAVNGEGWVYVFDHDHTFYHRLMVFEPESTGDFEHYVYAGDVAAGGGGVRSPTAPATDAAGNIYVGASTTGEAFVEEYAPEAPAPYPAPASNPICRFEFSKHGITGMTANPVNGEVFFYSYASPKRVHRLSPCDTDTGEFTETESFTVSPERGDLSGMAFDPNRQLPSRPAGVLYAGAPDAEPFSGLGKGEPGQSSLGYIFSRAKEFPPHVESQAVSHVTSTTAKLQAQVNPKGSASSYIFQYASEAEYEEAGESFAGAKEAPPGGAALGAGQEAISAAAAISGLQPDTEYLYRAVATSHCSVEDPAKVCEDAGLAQSFHTFPEEAPGLPDKRAWELVSPPQKHGGQVLAADPRIGTCPSEDFCKPGAFYTHFPMQSAPNGNAIVYEGTPFSPSEGAIKENEYIARRDEKTGWQTVNLTPALLQSGTGGYESFSADLAQGLLEQQTSPVLSPEAPPEYANLYSQPTDDPPALHPLLGQEPPNRSPGGLKLGYAGASADLSRVFFTANDALTEETAFAPQAEDGGTGKANLYEWSGGQLALVNVKPGNAETEADATFGNGSAHAISTDGSRAFWSDQAGHVYVREDGEVTKAIPDPGKFLSAATDGSRVLLDDGHLYDLETETTTDLAEGEGGFQGILGQSEGLSHVYFVDTAVLDAAPNGQGEVAQAAKDNLYTWEEGAATRFVARLTAGDNGGGSKNLSHDWNALPSSRTAETSPDGNWLAFQSQALLTGYDNTGPCESDHAGGFVSAPCPEVFLYDSTTEELTCASCNRSGARPLGWSVLRMLDGPSFLPQPQYLTDEGRLFFDSQDSLSQFDTNKRFEDVYEYEPNGVGPTCERADGCLSLISAGHEAADSNFLAADPSGANVFFTSRDQLVLKDKDDLIDLYDAREAGGIPSETEVESIPCQGEACQPAVVVPNDPTPGSSSFEGAGNVVEPKPGRKHHKRKRHAKKHANKRTAKHNRGGVK